MHEKIVYYMYGYESVTVAQSVSLACREKDVGIMVALV